VKCWGNLAAPTEVPGLTGIVAVSLGGQNGSHFGCALSEGGAVVCWGDDDKGQIGDGGKSYPATVPVPVAGLDSNVTAISAGGSHACAIHADTVVCWGANDAGQLGNAKPTAISTPVLTTPLGSGVVPVSLAAGADNTCIATREGRVFCWGFFPVWPVPSPTPIEADPGGFVVALSAFNLDDDTFALMDDGSVRAWGNNDHGQLGDGTTGPPMMATTPLLPKPVAVLAGGGFEHGCAIANDAVYCWGDNEYGQLGDGTTTARSTPVRVTGLPSRVAAIATGAYHSCSRTRDGSVYCWGFNDYQQLGMTTPSHSSAPVPVPGL
jgi:alpha-tubulin suppressor-like RCC1 family protein